MRREDKQVNKQAMFVVTRIVFLLGEREAMLGGRRLFTLLLHFVQSIQQYILKNSIQCLS